MITLALIALWLYLELHKLSPWYANPGTGWGGITGFIFFLVSLVIGIVGVAKWSLIIIPILRAIQPIQWQRLYNLL